MRLFLLVSLVLLVGCTSSGIKPAKMVKVAPMTYAATNTKSVTHKVEKETQKDTQKEAQKPILLSPKAAEQAPKLVSPVVKLVFPTNADIINNNKISETLVSKKMNWWFVGSYYVLIVVVIYLLCKLKGYRLRRFWSWWKGL